MGKITAASSEDFNSRFSKSSAANEWGFVSRFPVLM
jgi:hypothetical protein